MISRCDIVHTLPKLSPRWFVLALSISHSLAVSQVQASCVVLPRPMEAH